MEHAIHRAMRDIATQGPHYIKRMNLNGKMTILNSTTIYPINLESKFITPRVYSFPFLTVSTSYNNTASWNRFLSRTLMDCLVLTRKTRSMRRRIGFHSQPSSPSSLSPGGDWDSDPISKHLNGKDLVSKMNFSSSSTINTASSFFMSTQGNLPTLQMVGTSSERIRRLQMIWRRSSRSVCSHWNSISNLRLITAEHQPYLLELNCSRCTIEESSSKNLERASFCVINWLRLCMRYQASRFISHQSGNNERCWLARSVTKLSSQTRVAH